jgi:prepilin signal peptidase PulO-like enzyme (type II secretory pathway)
MIILPVLLSLVLGVIVNGLADNLPDLNRGKIRTMLFPRCRYCDSTRGFFHLAAIPSGIYSNGTCRHCSAPRPLRDLLVEISLGIGFCALWLTGRITPDVFFPSALIICFFLLIAVIDWEHRYVIGELLLVIAIIVLGWTIPAGWEGISRALQGAGMGLAIFCLLYGLGWVLGKVFHLGDGMEPLGFGDVLLAGLVGLITGWPAILMAAFLAIFLGGIGGIFLFGKHVFWKQPLGNVTMAYGPYLMLAGVLVYFAGPQLLDWLIRAIP